MTRHPVKVAAYWPAMAPRPWRSNLLSTRLTVEPFGSANRIRSLESRSSPLSCKRFRTDPSRGSAHGSHRDFVVDYGNLGSTCRSRESTVDDIALLPGAHVDGISSMSVEIDHEHWFSSHEDPRWLICDCGQYAARIRTIGGEPALRLIDRPT